MANLRFDLYVGMLTPGGPLFVVTEHDAYELPAGTVASLDANDRTTLDFPDGTQLTLAEFLASHRKVEAR